MLLIRLDTPLILDIPAFTGTTLASGSYAYCGSAYGPGGLAARIARHLRKPKPAHWHIDRLTGAGCVVAVGVRTGGRECDLVDELLAEGATIPIPGFGSSDCRRCASHMMAVAAEIDLATHGLDIITPALP